MKQYLRFSLVISCLIMTFGFFTLPASASQTTPIADCKDAYNGDGTFILCKGHQLILLNATGNVTLTTFDENSAKLKLTGANATNITLYKNRPKNILNDNGDILTLTYLKKSSKSISIKVQSDSSIDSKPCNDVATTNDGAYSACVGDTITNNLSGIKMTIDSFDKSSLKLAISGSNSSKISIPIFQSRILTSSNGSNKITVTYFDYTSTKAYIVIYSGKTFSVPTTCPTANSAGNDGSYSICPGGSIKHYTSNIVATAEQINNQSDTNGSIKLSLTNSASSAIYITKGGSGTVASNNGYKVTFQYVAYYPLTGAYITITSVPTVSSSNTYYIHGYTKDEFGSPLANIKIAVHRNDGSGITEANTYSDSNGYYDLQNIQLTKSIQYAIWADKEDGTMNGDVQIVDPDSRNTTFNPTLYYERKVDFSYKYNANGSNSFSSYSTNTGTIYTTPTGYNEAFDFTNGVTSSIPNGAFYISLENSINRRGFLGIYGNNIGMGGAYELGSGGINSFSIVSTSPNSYNKYGIGLTTGSNYAVYDEKHGAYGIIHINSITIIR
jgi:hypothetical protein